MSGTHPDAGLTPAELEPRALDLLGEELRQRALHLLERELLLLQHLAQPDPGLLLAEGFREADEGLVRRQLEMLGREGRDRVREIAQEVVVLRDAGDELLVLGDEAAEAGALLGLGRKVEIARTPRTVETWDSVSRRCRSKPARRCGACACSRRRGSRSLASCCSIQSICRRHAPRSSRGGVSCSAIERVVPPAPVRTLGVPGCRERG